MTRRLILSLFPGIDLLGRAFEEEGYCVVRGPDLIFAGDFHRFTAPADVFEGVIAGIPCQEFSGSLGMDSKPGRSVESECRGSVTDLWASSAVAH